MCRGLTASLLTSGSDRLAGTSSACLWLFLIVRTGGLPWIELLGLDSVALCQLKTPGDQGTLPSLLPAEGQTPPHCYASLSHPTPHISRERWKISSALQCMACLSLVYPKGRCSECVSRLGLTGRVAVPWVLVSDQGFYALEGMLMITYVSNDVLLKLYI